MTVSFDPLATVNAPGADEEAVSDMLGVIRSLDSRAPITPASRTYHLVEVLAT